ncbi:MAG TPA: sodium:solute symporter family protein [Dongiaceae bacterium]|nr:sodium:solute symporter family protein [Dongiaceae bacterium]
MFSTSPLDWLLVGVYFAFLVAVAFGFRRAGSSAAEYLLAGRRVTLPAFVATLVTTWYGGILGVGEYSYRYGLSNWLVFGVPYYVGALLFALLFAKRARAAELYTVPDLLERRYGRGASLMGAAMVFMAYAPAAYVLMLGTLFAAMTGWPLVPCILAASVLSIFYVDRGGLRTVVLTDQVQFVLMYASFILIFGFLVARHGWLPFLRAHVPATHWSWNGGQPAAAIFVWYFIALSTLVDPGFWQRAYAARDPDVARRGVLWSIAFWIVFDFLTTFTGLYARALLPNLREPVFAFPDVARLTLPPFALGLFYVGMIATVMSTIDAYGFIAATTIGRDVVWRLRGERTEERIPRYSRLGLWIAGAFAAGLAIAQPSVIELWRNLGSISTSTLLLPVGTALLDRGRLPARWTLAAMVLAFIVSLAWVLARAATPLGARFPFTIEPIYPGLATSLLAYATGALVTRRKVPA